MKTHKTIGTVISAPRKFLILTLSIFLLAIGVAAQPPSNPTPAPEAIEAGSLIIPMDNFHQADGTATAFNVRAYGLANMLLQNDIPVKWAIKPGKSKDATDFSASVLRIAGNQGVGSASDVAFAGGPFIISNQFDGPALRNLITTFNDAAPLAPVTVYVTTADTTADIRYTLNFRPKIAVGPDGGGFGAFVYQRLLARAGISNYTSVDDDITSEGKCFTLATQAHSDNPNFVNVYREFVEGGGNLLLQCRSIATFENHPQGHFQTTAQGYSVLGTTPNTGAIFSAAFEYPNGWMPFNQFLGALADQTGYVTEYSYAPGGGPANGNTVSVRNTGLNSDWMVASVSKIGGANAQGGVIFELGGHEYALPDANESDSALARSNGDRMMLNTIFVPASTICSQPQQAVIGYKSVRPITNRVGGPKIIPGEAAEWTIDYINNSDTNQFNFQVRDVIGEHGGYLSFVPNSLVVTPVNPSNGPEVTIAAVNPAYDGVGDDASSDQLAVGGYLPIGGRIQIKVRTLVDPNIPIPDDGYILYNQTRARSASILVAETTKSDAIDATNTTIFGIPAPPTDSVPQPQNVNQIDETRIVVVPTAGEASIEGRLINEAGGGVANAVITIVRGSTGESRSIRSNSFGVFRVDNLGVGEIYLLTVSHKRFRFPEEPTTVSLNDNVSGLTIIGRLPSSKTSVRASVETARIRR